MSEATGEGPSQEEVEAYLEQLRQAEPSDVIAQAYSVLGTAAEAKLGTSDARILIDAVSALSEAVGDRAGEQLGEGMRQGVARLQSAHVASGEGGEQPAGDGSGASAGAEEGSDGGGSAQTSDSRMTDRLWVPGQ